MAPISFRGKAKVFAMIPRVIVCPSSPIPQLWPALLFSCSRCSSHTALLALCRCSFLDLKHSPPFICLTPFLTSSIHLLRCQLFSETLRSTLFQIIKQAFCSSWKKKMTHTHTLYSPTIPSLLLFSALFSQHILPSDILFVNYPPPQTICSLGVGILVSVLFSAGPMVPRTVAGM